MKNNRCTDTSVFPEATEMNFNMNMDMGMGCCMPPMGCPGQTMMCPPIMECPQVRCCHRTINYEVPQV